MPYNVIVTPDAEADLAQAKQWYNDQSAGLGDRFLECVGLTFARLEFAPEAHAVVHSRYRRTLVPRFPFVVYYQILESTVSITAVLHGRRHARHWKRRI